VIGGADEWERISWIDVQANTGVFGAEIRRPVREGTAAAIAGGDTEDHVFGQIFVFGTEAVGDPRAKGGMLEFAWMTAGLPGELSAVVVMNGPEGSDDGKVIGTFTDVPKPIANDEAGIAVLFIAALERHDGFAIAVLRIGTNDILAFGGEDMFIRSLFDRFAGVFVEFGLYVETLEVADAATEKNPDDAPGCRCKVRLKTVCSDAGSAGVPKLHGGECEASEAHPGISEEGAAGNSGTVFLHITGSL
jgi:hypothetical protein